MKCQTHCPITLQKKVTKSSLMKSFYLFYIKLELKDLILMEMEKFKSSKILETPRNRYYLPRTPKNEKLQFLDSSIPRGIKSSKELPSLVHRNQSRFELRPITQYVFGNLNWISKEIIFRFGSFLEKVIKSFGLQKGQNYVQFVIEWPPHSQ